VLADDLDAPGALAAVDRWADDARRREDACSATDQSLVRDAVNALLGVEL
jgi:L-cysteine:1D-myo-inositol 2-amino-2-deoxy-alpha-D-glucopyranoside ligase